MAQYSVWMVECGNAVFSADQAYNGFHRAGEPLLIPLSAIVIKGEGRLVLIDTGVDPDLPETAAILRDRGYTGCRTAAYALEQLSFTARDVTDIILTHAHWDHIGAIHLFADAHFYIQKDEFFAGLEYLALPEKFSILARCFDIGHFEELLKLMRTHRLTLLDGPRPDLFPGIHIRLARDGHTAAGQMVEIETGTQSFLAVGDAALTAANVTGVDGRYLPMSFKTASGCARGMLRTMDDIHRFCNGDIKRVLIQHDCESWSRYPGKINTDGLHVAEIRLAPGETSRL
jgi:glyoxylase-like metal-dependent hydrolase (beta-lactamase superfamily II)